LPSIPPTTITPASPPASAPASPPDEPLEPAADEPLEPLALALDEPLAPELPELAGTSPGHGVKQLPPQSIPDSSPSRTPFMQLGLVSATLLPVLALFADVHAEVEARVPSKTSIPATTVSVRTTASSPRSCSSQEGGGTAAGVTGDGL
jgi:hypothetical protein